MAPDPLMRLQCRANSYGWGKKGFESTAARFAAATSGEDFSIQPDQPYAEFWMGTHPSNPSRDAESGWLLEDVLRDNPQLVSISPWAKFNGRLPFLFKVLSINSALSIQAHSNKKLAAQLRANDPKNYPDDNHKPEMAIALTTFEGLCGFRPLDEIIHYLETVTPLRALIKEEHAREFIAVVNGTAAKERQSSDTKDPYKAALQQLFASLMSATPDEIEAQAAALVSLAKADAQGFAGSSLQTMGEEGATLAELVLRLNEQFPGDIGLFVIFLLNYVRLDAGEAIFLRADDIHAYFSGDIVECMAASDNVVRAGFTSKFKDVSTLVSMLTYSYAPIDEQKMKPLDYAHVTLDQAALTSGSRILLYDPPIDEFSVIRAVLRGNTAKATFAPIDGPSILICTHGRGVISTGSVGKPLGEGFVYFIAANVETCLEQTGDLEDDLIVFKAFCKAGDDILNV